MNLEGTKGKQNKKQKQINLTIQFPKEQRRKINALNRGIRRKLLIVQHESHLNTGALRGQIVTAS